MRGLLLLAIAACGATPTVARSAPHDDDPCAHHDYAPHGHPTDYSAPVIADIAIAAPSSDSTTRSAAGAA